MLLSGGVDSSTALWELAQDRDARVTAYYLKVWLEDELAYLGSCPWEEDLAYAREVCRRLGVELRVVPLQLEYYERVVQYTLDELRHGRTPSPDIFCNQRIKFGAFWDYLTGTDGRSSRTRESTSGGCGAGRDGDIRIATGHYARLRDAGDHVELLRAPDPVKDQTYFLSHLGQDQLRRIAFPIGGYMKDEVRRRAHRYDLPNKERKDSQGICFLGKIRYPEFIRHYLGTSEGPIREEGTGRELGRHQGYWFYTIGQRQGLGLSGGPWYVVAKDVESNTIVVSHSHDAASKARREFQIGELSWTWRPPESGMYLLKIRHGPALLPSTVEWVRGGSDTMQVTLDEPDRGVAAGQFAVLYSGQVCLGSGKILEG